MNSDNKELASTAKEQQVQNNEEKLVPVTESIKYRKRAQSAEKQLEIIDKELQQTKTQIELFQKKLQKAKTTQALTEKLIACGTIDLESALLVARAKIEKDNSDIDTTIGQLQKDKSFLFNSKPDITGPATTASVKNKQSDSLTILKKTAQKASESGSRNDLQEYLKIRRNII